MKQPLIDGDIESNPGPTQNDFKSPVGHTKKIKVFKGTSKKCDLSENNVHVVRDSKAQNCFFNTIQPVSLDLLSYGQLLALALWSQKCKKWNLR